MRTINIGVVGMGWMGQVHSRSYLQVPLRFPESGIHPRLVICSDTVAERAQQGKAVLGFERATADWREVVEHPDVQVINVCTPNNLHVEVVRAAAQAGKAIFCEKPVGRTPEETALIEAAARQAAVISGVGYNYRWVPLVQYLRGLIGQGTLGEITHYRARFFSMYGSDPYGLLTWRFDFDAAGYGVLGDLGSHIVDMTLMLAGPIKRVTSQKHTFITERPKPIPGKGTHYSVGSPGDPTGPVTNEDYIGALLEFENGARGTLESSRTVFGPKSQFAFEIHGTKGAANWDFERMNELRLYLPDGKDAHDGFTRVLSGEKYPHHGHFAPGEGVGIGYEDLKVIELYEFLRSVAARRQHTPGFSEALAAAEVCAAMVRSWSSGAWEAVTSLKKEP